MIGMDRIVERFVSRRVVVTLAAAALIASLGTASAPGVETRQLRSQQVVQLRARQMTRELVNNVLAIQARQLEENGLQRLPIYEEIVSMRDNIDGLVEEQMKQVVELLVTAQKAPVAEREQHYLAARDQVRDIVVQLSIERQKLLRRLKIAQIAAQVRELIALESKVLSTTEGLPQLRQNDREAVTLRTVEKQRDIKALYLQLVITLNDVSQWGGKIGEGAADGLRILKAGDAEAHLDAAIAGIAASDVEPAVEHEREVIRVLRALLDQVEKT
ncbi:MAG: hypothetical protein KDA42_17615, partial [Planctomycetales bacterium]|nr:hypothetical protein [Planctomycetales bacterium]